MLVLMREDLARELGRADHRGARSATACRPTATTRRRRTRKARARAARSRPRWPRRAWRPSDVDYVNSHGTGTAKNDPAETAATKFGLGEHAYETAVSAARSR